ncbi:MAG TPA: hypothetical protein PK657_05440 [Legionella sp.]|nr:hypothetical protein [Legionella sp.]
MYDPWNQLIYYAQDYNQLEKSHTHHFQFPDSKWEVVQCFNHINVDHMSNIDYLETLYSITNHTTQQMREAALMEEYFLIEPNKIKLTKNFLDFHLNQLKLPIIESEVNLFLTYSGNQLLKVIPGFTKPTLVIHIDFLKGLFDKNSYTVEELQFGLSCLLYEIKFNPIPDDVSLQDQFYFDSLALKLCKNGEAAKSYLKKYAEFEHNNQKEIVFIKRIRNIHSYYAIEEENKIHPKLKVHWLKCYRV